jgi:hypothetical protein
VLGDSWGDGSAEPEPPPSPVKAPLLAMPPPVDVLAPPGRAAGAVATPASPWATRVSSAMVPRLEPPPPPLPPMPWSCEVPLPWLALEELEPWLPSPRALDPLDPLDPLEPLDPLDPVAPSVPVVPAAASPACPLPPPPPLPPLPPLPPSHSAPPAEFEGEDPLADVAAPDAALSPDLPAAFGVELWLPLPGAAPAAEGPDRVVGLLRSACRSASAAGTVTCVGVRGRAVGARVPALSCRSPASRSGWTGSGVAIGLGSHAAVTPTRTQAIQQRVTSPAHRVITAPTT